MEMQDAHEPKQLTPAQRAAPWSPDDGTKNNRTPTSEMTNENTAKE